MEDSNIITEIVLGILFGWGYVILFGGGWIYLLIEAGVAIFLVIMMNIIIKTVESKVKAFTKEEEGERKRAIEEDREAHKMDKAEMDAERKKKRAIAADKLVPYNLKLETVLKECASHEEKLCNLPGLAMQDKKIEIVDKLISYMERGRADSIKEALNLYVSENNEYLRYKARLEVESVNRQLEFDMLKIEQDAAISSIQFSQQLHNERIEELERKRNEELESLSKEIRDKLNE